MNSEISTKEGKRFLIGLFVMNFSWKSAISNLQIDPALKSRDPNKKWGSKEKKAIKGGFKVST